MVGIRNEEQPMYSTLYASSRLFILKEEKPSPRGKVELIV